MNYDPDLRRDTPLARKLKEHIRNEGPMLVDDYMTACLLDEESGYYKTRHAIGSKGDFITAPEISQIFGELVGLWCVETWRAIGQGQRVKLIELGPGRGTLMRDALRASGVAADFRDNVFVALSEVNPLLATLQATTLAGCGVPIGHYETLLKAIDAFDGSCHSRIVIGNEWLDVAPVRQLVHHDGAWYHRRIGLDAADRLVFVPGRKCAIDLPACTRDAGDGDIFEMTFAHRHEFNIFARAPVHAKPNAALFIDYGHDEPALGETLQAVRGHAFEHPLTSPGEADLTAQVDFASFAREARRLGLAVDGPITQAEFLGRLGIVERASRLMAANPDKAAGIEAGVARLMAPNGMGTRFKAIGIRSPDLAPLPGF